MVFSTLVVLTLGGYLASFAQIHPAEIWAAIGHMGWGAAGIALAGNFAQILFLIIRYYLLIPREVHPGALRVVYAIGLGHAVNLSFPARAGDVLKCYLLSKNRPKKLTLLSSTGVILVDRVVDVVALLLMGIIWKAYKHPKMQEWIAGMPGYTNTILIVLALGILGAGAYFLFVRKGQRASKWSKEFRIGLRCLWRPKWVLGGLLMGMLSWTGELVSLMALSQALGFDLTFGNAVFVTIALNLAIAVPISLANVGPFEAAVALSLTSFGMGSSEAFAVATVHHALQLVAIGIWSLISLGARSKLQGSSRSPR